MAKYFVWDGEGETSISPILVNATSEEEAICEFIKKVEREETIDEPVKGFKYCVVLVEHVRTHTIITASRDLRISTSVE